MSLFVICLTETIFTEVLFGLNQWQFQPSLPLVPTILAIIDDDSAIW